MIKRKYILKDGVVLHPYGVNSLIDNSNITDNIAKLFLENGKAKLSSFVEEEVEIIIPKKKAKFKK